MPTVKLGGGDINDIKIGSTTINKVYKGDVLVYEKGPDGSPSSLTLTVISDTQINLSWTNGSTNEDGISIERSTDNVTYTVINTTASGVSSYSNTGLTENTTYYYKVRAVKGSKLSASSNVVNATTEIPLQNLIQKISGKVEADGFTLLDESLEGNNALLVNSNCSSASGSSAIVSTDLTTDNLLAYNFSVEFNIIFGTVAGFQGIFGRSITGAYANWLSLFIVDTGALKYYSGNGALSSATTIIASLAINTVYRVKASISNSTGRIDWVVNGVAGGANFTNYTPATAVALENFSIARHHGTTWIFTGKKWGFKYYASVNYANLSHYWPMAEGYGNINYDVIGTKHLTVDANITWGQLQDYLHYNYTKGFELYGNSDATSTLLRIPYNNDGTKITPTISGFTKFANCDAGEFHNFAETGIKRNPLNDAVLAASGVSDTNVIYYGGVDGNDGYSFCKDFMEEENTYCVYSISENRKSRFKMPLSTYGFTAGSVRKILGASGKIHNTNFKLALTQGAYDFFIRNGTYIFNQVAQRPLVLLNGTGLIGQSRTGTILNCDMPDNIAKADMNYFINAPNGYTMSTLTATAKNSIYVVHSDGTIIADIHRTVKNATFIHYGNEGAWVIDNTQLTNGDAFGTGWFDGMVTRFEDCYLEGYSHAGSYTTGRGFAGHATIGNIENTAATHYFIRTEFKSANGSAVVRKGILAATTKKDSMTFEDCIFNDGYIYVDTLSVYDPMADKIKLYIKSGNTKPVINADIDKYIGLEFRCININDAISAVAGTTTTLLMGSPINDLFSGYANIIGDKNINDGPSLTGHVHLGSDMLQDCSSVNKTMQIIVDGTTYTITFDANYTSLTNVQVVAAINAKLSALNCPTACYLYDFGLNAKFIEI